MGFTLILNLFAFKELSHPDKEFTSFKQKNVTKKAHSPFGKCALLYKTLKTYYIISIDYQSPTPKTRQVPITNQTESPLN